MFFNGISQRKRGRNYSITLSSSLKNLIRTSDTNSSLRIMFPGLNLLFHCIILRKGSQAEDTRALETLIGLFKKSERDFNL
jgi:hypothetical protein